MPFRLMRLTDCGAYLTDGIFKGAYGTETFYEPEIRAVLSRAWDYDLEKIIIIGTSLTSSTRALQIAKSDRRLYCTVGCKPSKCHQIAKSEKYCHDMLSVSQSDKKKIVAIGEMGLDYRQETLSKCDKEKQISGFEYQVELGIALDKPLVLYYRGDSFYDVITTLSKSKYYTRIKGGLVHSFTGTPLEASELIRKGYYIGISGCSLKNKEGIKLVKGLPLNRIVVESCAPYCEIKWPHPAANYNITKFFSSRKTKISKDGMVAGRTEPAHVINVLEAVAGVKKMGIQELADIVRGNMKELFFEEKPTVDELVI